MSSLPRPMVSLGPGAVADLAPPPGPPTAHSAATDARRCILAPSPGRCRRAAARTTSPTATSAAGALLSLSGAFAAALDGVAV